MEKEIFYFKIKKIIYLNILIKKKKYFDLNLLKINDNHFLIIIF